MPKKEYLGDSVYVEFNVMGDLILTTENGLPGDPSNEIMLDDHCITALLRYLDRVRAARAAEHQE